MRGDAGGDPGDELAGLERAAGDHDRHRHLAGPLVGPRDDGGVGHLRVAGQQRLELGRRHLDRVDLDQLFEPVDDEQVPVGVDPAQVAGAKPAAVPSISAVASGRPR